VTRHPMDDDELIDLAGAMGSRDAGKYLGRFGRYPTEDDDSDEGTKSWQCTWEALRAKGADGGIMDAAFEAWKRGWLG
jgi:hypothetical protein